MPRTMAVVGPAVQLETSKASLLTGFGIPFSFARQIYRSATKIHVICSQYSHRDSKLWRTSSLPFSFEIVPSQTASFECFHLSTETVQTYIIFVTQRPLVN